MQLRHLTLALILGFTSLALAQNVPQARFNPSQFFNAQVERGAGELSDIYDAAQSAAVRVETRGGGVGSGFFISADGQVMSAYHVVRGGGGVRVVTSDGSRLPATVVGFDEFRDVALLQVEADEPRDFLPLETTTPTFGEDVLAIGNSRGQFNAPRSGRVTALGQTLGASFPEDLIAMTVPLAPGDSGGPVLNAQGEVIGVVTAVSVSRAGIASFAAPVFEQAAFVDELRAGLQRSVPFLGVSLLPLTPEAVAELGFGEPGGLLVTGVVSGSGADAAGLREPVTEEAQGQNPEVRAADIITAVDGREVANFDDLVGYLRTLSIGDEVLLSLLREGEVLEVSVTLGSREAV